MKPEQTKLKSINKSKIAKFSATFVKRYRITTLMFIAIMGLGFYSYNTLLKVEGFPAVEIPVVFVEGNYFVNDPDQVNDELTQPIEDAAAKLSEITRVTSTTTPVGTFIAAEFDDSVTSKDGKKLLKEQIDSSVDLPDGASLEYRIINAGAMDGKHDLIFNVSKNGESVEDLQKVAEKVAKEVRQSPDAASAEIIPLIEQRLNPVTGQPVNYQSGFNRVAYRDADGNLVYENAVSVGVIAKQDVGSVDLSGSVKEKVNEFIDTGVIDDYQITYGGDLSPKVLQQRDSLETNAIIGLLSVMVLILLLIDWRASIVGGIFIPLVFAGVFLALYVLGYSLNVISLFSLVLVLGIFVDNATVVIDALDRAKDEGYKGRDAVKQAVGVIGTSVIAGTWTTILVFIPMMFISGVLGEFIILIPITVITALLISLFLTLTVVPWLGNLFIRDKSERPAKPQSILGMLNAGLNYPSRFIAWLSKQMQKFINSYLAKRWKIFAIIVIALGLIGWGGSYAQRLDFSVFPAAKDTDQLVVTIDYPAETTLGDAEDIAQDVEQILEDEIGDELLALTYYVADDKNVMLMADLTEVGDRDRTSTDMLEALQAKPYKDEDVRVVYKAQSSGPPVDDFQITVKVLADSESLLEKGTKDVKNFLEDRELSDGESVTEVAVDRFDVLTKVDGRRFAQVKAKISDPKKTNLVLELQEAISEEYTKDKIEDLGLRGEAVTVDLGQEGDNVESFQSAGVAFIVALIVMYGLLVLQFSSFTQPLLIFLAIPFSFPVLFPALFITENSLSFFVMLGLIALAGVVVNNTIMLVHQANLLRAEGSTPREAISKSVGIRFRALLATSLTTIAGLLPLAMSDPFWEPLAFTIIFGLASSVVMALFVFPAFYIVVEAIRDWSANVGRKRKARI